MQKFKNDNDVINDMNDKADSCCRYATIGFVFIDK